MINYDLGVFCHLGNINLWNDINIYLHRIPFKFQLYINYIEGTLDNKDEIMNEYPETIFFWSENRGADIGPFFIFMNYLRENNITHKWITKIHSKTDPKWRNHMLNFLFPENYQEFYDKLDINQKILGSYKCPYDYINIYWDLKNLDLLGIKINKNWDKFNEKYPELKECTAFEKILHIVKNNIQPNLIPYIDEELYQQLFGPINIDMKILENTVKGGFLMNITRPLIKGYYYPGTCYIFNHEIFNKVFNNVSYIDIVKNMEIGKPNDKVIQSNTHSWERIIPMALLYEDS
jgi:hypothetical protein